MKSKFVLITTEHRGVFAGELVEHSETTVKLANARCAIYWNTKTGFLELASNGPNSGSKISATADAITLYGVTSISDCTSEAERAWRAA